MLHKRSTLQLNSRLLVLVVVATILATLFYNTRPVFAEGAPGCQVMIALSDTENVIWIPYQDGSMRATTTYSGMEIRSDCDAVLVQKWRLGKLVESYPIIAEGSYLIIEYEYFYTGDEGGADEIAVLINYATDHPTVYRLRYDQAGAETRMHQEAATQQAQTALTPTPEPLPTEVVQPECQVNVEYTGRDGMPHTLAAFVDTPSDKSYESWETNGDEMVLSSNCRVMISWYTSTQIQDRSLFDPDTDNSKLIVPFEYTAGAERSELVQFVTVPENGPSGRQIIMVNVPFVLTKAAQPLETPTPTLEVQDFPKKSTNSTGEETMTTSDLPIAALMFGTLVLIGALVTTVIAQSILLTHARRESKELTLRLDEHANLTKLLQAFGTRLDVLDQVWGGVERANQLAAQLAQLQGSMVTGVRGTHFIIHRNDEVLRFTVATELFGSNATYKLQHLCQILGIAWNKVQDDVRQVYINGQNTRLLTCHHNFTLGDTVEIWFKR